MFKYLTNRALRNLDKSFGDYEQFRGDRLFHAVTLFMPEKGGKAGQDLYFVRPSLKPIQRMMINRFPLDYLRAMADHIVTSRHALDQETNLGQTGLQFANDIEDELTPLCYKANLSRLHLTGEMEGIHKDIHVLAKDYQDIHHVNSTYKPLSQNPMINLHYYLPANTTHRPSTRNEGGRDIEQSSRNEGGRDIEQSRMSVHMLEQESPYIVQMLDKVKALQAERKRNNIRQGSRKVLLEMGHGGNILYGEEHLSRMVDQLVVVLVMGQVAPEHLGRKFVSLGQVMRHHECNHESGLKEEDKLVVKVLRFQQNKSTEEVVEEYLHDSAYKYKHLFSKTK